MRRPNRVSPPVLVAFVTSVVILVGFIAFVIASSRQRSDAPGNVNVTVGGGPTPTSVVVNVTAPGAPTAVPTLVPPPTVTSAPLATLPPEPTAVPTRTPLPPPPTVAPPPTRIADAIPPPAPALPQTEPPPAAPKPGEAVPPEGAQPPPEPPAAPVAQPTPTAVPPAASKPAPGQPAPAQPPPSQPLPPTPTPPTAGPAPAPPAAAKPPAQPAPAQAEPSPAGGFGNTRRDFEAAYGPAVGRSPEGFDVFQTNSAEIQVAFRDDRAERIRLKLRNDRVVPLDEARNLARSLIPRDAAPVSSTGENTGRPVDQFRSAALGLAFPRSGGNFSIRYTPAATGTFSGFEIATG